MNTNEIVFVYADYEPRPVGGNLVESSPVVGFQSQPPQSQFKIWALVENQIHLRV